MAKLTKLSDDKFKGMHPNNVHKGYEKEGHVHTAVIVGQCFRIANFISSRVTEILEETPTTTKFKTKNSTYLLRHGIKEFSAVNDRIIELPQDFRRDFRSVDKQTAISAEGVMFKVGDVVKHSGDENNVAAAITKFTLDTETMDVMAHSSEGVGRICFLYHLED